MCDCGAVEKEIHFTFHCKPFSETRKMYLTEFMASIGIVWRVLKDDRDEIDLDNEKCIEAMSKMLFPENIRKFAEWLESMYLARRSIILR